MNQHKSKLWVCYHRSDLICVTSLVEAIFVFECLVWICSTYSLEISPVLISKFKLAPPPTYCMDENWISLRYSIPLSCFLTKSPWIGCWWAYKKQHKVVSYSLLCSWRSLGPEIFYLVVWILWCSSLSFSPFRFASSKDMNFMIFAMWGVKVAFQLYASWY